MIKNSLIFIQLIITILLSIIFLFAQGPDTLWTKTYGGIEYDEALSVQETADCGFIIAGYTSSFGAGNWDVYLIRTNMGGDTLWTKTYGGVEYDWGESVQQTLDNGYIIGGGTNSFGAGMEDVYIIKINSTGDTVWTKTYGGVNTDWGVSVRQTSDGGYIIVGSTYSFGSGDSDVYLIKTDGIGDTIWTKTYGGISWDEGHSVQQTPDGGFIIVGETYSFGAGGDVYLLKTDSTGDTVWTKTYGGVYSDFGVSVRQTSDSGYIIVGSTYSFGSGDSDVYLIKTDGIGDTIWTRTFGDSTDDDGYSVNETSENGYIIVGSVYSFIKSGEDVYLLKLNGNGNLIWEETYGGVLLDIGNSVQQTFDNGYIIAGYTASFGAGSYDFYLIKTEADIGINERDVVNPRAKIEFLSVSPNPFLEKTQISYALCSNSRIHQHKNPVSLEIYDITGKEVRNISITSSKPSIPMTLEWNGKDNTGKTVPSGVYFLLFRTVKKFATRKITRIGKAPYKKEQ